MRQGTTSGQYTKTEIFLAVKSYNLRSYLKVCTGIKEKNYKKKIFWHRRKFVFWTFFWKKKFFYLLIWQTIAILSTFASSCVINLFVTDTTHNGLQSYVGSIKVWARPGIKKCKNVNIRQWGEKIKKRLPLGSNSRPPACKSNALTIQPRWLTT